MKFRYPFGSNPLDPNEIEGLIPTYITTQYELDEAEQENILRGELWAHRQKSKDILTEKFVKRLHKEMFSDVWRWAGGFRRSDKNLGVVWAQISTELHKLLKDAQYWIKNETYDWTELSARFHHRLVWIHCFSNGNSRHARTMTQILLLSHEQEPLSWGYKGKKKWTDLSEIRKRYIEALRAADQKDLRLLLKFVRS